MVGGDEEFFDTEIISLLYRKLGGYSVSISILPVVYQGVMADGEITAFSTV